MKKLAFIFCTLFCIDLFPLYCMSTSPVETVYIPEVIIVKQEEKPQRVIEQVKEEKFVIPDHGYSEDEIKLIALIMKGEAEGESEYGKRLVIDTILNRIDSGYFPNTVEEVIYQRSQFSCTTNGRLDRVKIDGNDYALVVEELDNRISKY